MKHIWAPQEEKNCALFVSAPIPHLMWESSQKMGLVRHLDSFPQIEQG